MIHNTKLPAIYYCEIFSQFPERRKVDVMLYSPRSQTKNTRHIEIFFLLPKRIKLGIMRSLVSEENETRPNEIFSAFPNRRKLDIVRYSPHFQTRKLGIVRYSLRSQTEGN
jgi:hypothetical protein